MLHTSHILILELETLTNEDRLRGAFDNEESSDVECTLRRLSTFTLLSKKTLNFLRSV